MERLHVKAAAARYGKSGLARKMGLSKQRVGQMVICDEEVYIEFDGERAVSYYKVRKIKQGDESGSKKE